MSGSRARVCGIAFAMLASACGGGSGGSTTGGVPTTDPTPGSACEQFDGTFEAIQKVIFESQGCTQDVCHGSARSGGLDLTPGVGVREPLRGARRSGSAIPARRAGRQATQLPLAEARGGDAAGQRRDRRRADAERPAAAHARTSSRRCACGSTPARPRPASVHAAPTQSCSTRACRRPKPITIEPLDPPAPGEGVQFVMPPCVLPARSRARGLLRDRTTTSPSRCPSEFQDPSAAVFRFDGSRAASGPAEPPPDPQLLRRSPRRRRRTIRRSARGRAAAASATARPASRPTSPSCGDGLCASELEATARLHRLRPARRRASTSRRAAIARAQTAQQYVPPRDGVFAQIPMKGVALLELARVQPDRRGPRHERAPQLLRSRPTSRYPVRSHLRRVARSSRANAPPYTTQTCCNDHVAAAGRAPLRADARTRTSAASTSRSTLPDGTQIYENFVYNDPVEQDFDPPLAFDSPDPAERTLRYCAHVQQRRRRRRLARSRDGDARRRACRERAHDVGAASRSRAPRARSARRATAPTTTRRATRRRAPATATATPAAITGGESTENEMFILIGNYYEANE